MLKNQYFKNKNYKNVGTKENGGVIQDAIVK